MPRIVRVSCFFLCFLSFNCITHCQPLSFSLFRSLVLYKFLSPSPPFLLFAVRSCSLSAASALSFDTLCARHSPHTLHSLRLPLSLSLAHSEAGSTHRTNTQKPLCFCSASAALLLLVFCGFSFTSKHSPDSCLSVFDFLFSFFFFVCCLFVVCSRDYT